MKTQRLLIASIALIGIPVICPTPATAEPKTHDGLYLRLSPGVAGTAAGTVLANDDDLGVGGIAAYFGLGVGYAINKSLLVGLAASSQVVPSPTVSLNDETTETDDDVSWGLHLVGAEGIFYVNSINAFVSLSLGAMVMTIELPEEDGRSQVGFGGALSLGKEWWIGPEVGLGVSVNTTIGAIPDGDLDWGAVGFGLAASVTIN